MNPLLPMIPSALDVEKGRACFLDTIALYDEMCRAQRTVSCILDPRQGWALWARIGIYGTELDRRCAAEFGNEDPTPLPWRDAKKTQPDADEMVLAVHSISEDYVVAVFEQGEIHGAGAWLDAHSLQPVAITHWMPLIGILEPPTLEH